MKLPTQSLPIERTTYTSHGAGAGAEACSFWSSLANGALSAAKVVGPALLGAL